MKCYYLVIHFGLNVWDTWFTDSWIVHF